MGVGRGCESVNCMRSVEEEKIEKETRVAIMVNRMNDSRRSAVMKAQSWRSEQMIEWRDIKVNE